MAILIFKLRHVPEDEALEVRQLLLDNDIEYHETSAGVLGISVPGLWLKDEAQAEKARQLIDAYQETRLHRAQQATARSFREMFMEAPVRYIGIVLAILLIAYLMLFMFFHL